jgi:hypothetical protein
MTKKSTAELQLNCIMIENLVRSLTIKGISNNEDLVSAVDTAFHPENEWEMEMYSDAILYAKYSVLN